jgi:hypothetical protein
MYVGYLYASGHKNADNNGYQSADNFRLIYEMPLHDTTVGLWSVANATEIPSAILFPDMRTSKRYALSTHTNNNKHYIQVFPSPIIKYHRV